MISLNDVLLARANIPVDDPIAEIWGRGLQGGYKIIEYTGSLPITINANGDVLIDYRIYGTDGGVGVATENLFDPNAKNVDNGYIAKATIGIDGVITTESSGFNTRWVYVTEYIPVDSNTDYVIFMNLFRASVDWATGLVFYDENKDLISGIRGCIALEKVTYERPFFGRVTFKTPGNCKYIRTNVDISATMLMLVAASPPPPAYIPYGYKLPMTVSDGNTEQTVPVYIGENQLDSVEGVADYVDKASGKIVRMIGEYTFTGDESFNKYGNSDVFYTSKTIDPVGITTVNTITMRCNHSAFTAIENKDTRYWLNPEADNICCFLPGGRSQVFFRSTSNFTTAAECKAYLKAQYDNGTPVKISYWLKTPVEEDPPVPFPDIPTINGETVIDYDGDPKPSQMYIKYKGKG